MLEIQYINEVVVKRVSHQIKDDLKYVFISGSNSHLTSRFCGFVLGSTIISKMVSKPLQECN